MRSIYKSLEPKKKSPITVFEEILNDKSSEGLANGIRERTATLNKALVDACNSGRSLARHFGQLFRSAGQAHQRQHPSHVEVAAAQQNEVPVLGLGCLLREDERDALQPERGAGHFPAESAAAEPNHQPGRPVQSRPDDAQAQGRPGRLEHLVPHEQDAGHRVLRELPALQEARAHVAQRSTPRLTSSSRSNKLPPTRSGKRPTSSPRKRANSSSLERSKSGEPAPKTSSSHSTRS